MKETQEGYWVRRRSAKATAVQFIDPAAVAVYYRMSVKDLGWLDAAYTPPVVAVGKVLISEALKAAKT